jgi:hypothetical protein
MTRKSLGYARTTAATIELLSMSAVDDASDGASDAGVLLPIARTSFATAGSTSTPSPRRRVSPSLLPAGVPPASGSTCPTPPSTPQRENPEISPASLPPTKSVHSPHDDEAKRTNGKMRGGRGRREAWRRALAVVPCACFGYESRGAVRARFKF